VFVVGGLGVESVRRTKKLSKEQLEPLLGCTFGSQNLLLVFHPETAEKDKGLSTLLNLLEGLEDLNEARVFCSMPNADAGNQQLRAAIEEHARKHQNVTTFVSIGASAYVSLLHYCDAILGNSSSGILEAPGVGIPTLNVGSRQHGRISPPSVISCSGDRSSISSGLKRVLDPTHVALAREVAGRGFDQNASSMISDALERVLMKLPPRRFVDIASI